MCSAESAGRARVIRVSRSVGPTDPDRGVDDQLLGDGRAKRLGVLQQDLPEIDGSVDRRAIDERARRIDRANLIVGAPAAQRIEVLQRIAKRERSRDDS